MQKNLPLYLIAKETGQDISLVKSWPWEKVVEWIIALRLLSEKRAQIIKDDMMSQITNQRKMPNPSGMHHITKRGDKFIMDGF